MGTRQSGRGRNEVSAEKVRQAETLLAERRPKAAIARALQISLQTVRRIAAGKHVVQRQRSRYQRCKCGALCLMPCGTCAAREYRQQMQVA